LNNNIRNDYDDNNNNNNNNILILLGEVVYSDNEQIKEPRGRWLKPSWIQDK
jgi:hypothetical protein